MRRHLNRQLIESFLQHRVGATRGPVMSEDLLVLDLRRQVTNVGA
jgi:hypothetical protein